MCSLGGCKEGGVSHVKLTSYEGLQVLSQEQEGRPHLARAQKRAKLFIEVARLDVHECNSVLPSKAERGKWNHRD